VFLRVMISRARTYARQLGVGRLLWRIQQPPKRLVSRALGRARARLFLLKLRTSRRRVISEYFQKNPVRKLQLGSGINVLSGWLNSDGFEPTAFNTAFRHFRGDILLNVLEEFPFVDCSVDYIFSEHLIEHLTYHQGQSMLSECFRVTKPGGRIRIAAPDFEVFIGLYGKDIGAEQQHFINEYVRFNSTVWSSDLAHVKANKAVFVLNHNFRAWGHQFIYDFSTLAESLRAAGFVDIARRKPAESPDPHLRGLEFRKETVGVFDALIVEGTKPAVA
jgi:predicted SAM-dependent methyltransferase